MRFFKLAVTVVRTAHDVWSGRSERLRTELDDARDELDALKIRHEYQERRSLDYFEVIETMQADRDRWKSKFFEESSQHQTAQAMLEQGIETAARLASRLLEAVNVYREREKEPLWTMPAVMESLPKTSEAYGARMKALADAAPPSPDGLAAREKLGPPTIS